MHYVNKTNSSTTRYRAKVDTFPFNTLCRNCVFVQILFFLCLFLCFSVYFLPVVLCMIVYSSGEVKTCLQNDLLYYVLSMTLNCTHLLTT